MASVLLSASVERCFVSRMQDFLWSIFRSPVLTSEFLLNKIMIPPYFIHVWLCAEFLKAATVRPCGRAKMFRNCARFEFLNPQMHNSPHVRLFWVISLKHFRFCMPFYLCKTSQLKFWKVWLRVDLVFALLLAIRWEHFFRGVVRVKKQKTIASCWFHRKLNFLEK